MRRYSGLLAGGICCLMLFPFTGCGQSVSQSSMKDVLAHAEAPATASQSSEAVLALTSGGQENTVITEKRKIIYTANVELVVKDFGKFEHQVLELIQKYDGFAAERSADRNQGQHRSGNWVIRVPVNSYQSMMQGIGALGFARSRTETTDDVTEDYVDLQARISNKKKLESRIIAMLEERPGKLSELMEIERELSRVREEIERMEGRMRVLMDQTSLATIHLRVDEELPYEPPTAPGFTDKIAASWGGSIRALSQLAIGAVVTAVALLPWVTLLIPVVIVLYRSRQRIKATATR